MITVNSLSGGKTSSYLAAHFPADHNVFSVVCIDDVRCKVKDPSFLKYAQEKLCLFVDRYGEFIASAESDRTLAVMRDLEQFIGKRIDWVRGDSFDGIIDNGKAKYLPSWARRYCTVEMKLKPIFEYWFQNFSEPVNMRIGFRFDEFKRMERFFNRAPNEFKVPVSQSVKISDFGILDELDQNDILAIISKEFIKKGRQKWKSFNWRYCSFPLVEGGITKKDIDEFWLKNGFVGGNLFEERRKMDFPPISNCVGCFHKKIPTLATMAKVEAEKIQWFADQEKKGMGTWLDSKKTYQSIIENASDLHKETFFEYTILGQSCDSGGCID